LAGVQLNLIRDTCDYLYRLEDDQARQVIPEAEPEELTELEVEVV
jgi:CRISPR-associated protein Csc3